MAKRIVAWTNTSLNLGCLKLKMSIWPLVDDFKRGKLNLQRFMCYYDAKMNEKSLKSNLFCKTIGGVHMREKYEK